MIARVCPKFISFVAALPIFLGGAAVHADMSALGPAQRPSAQSAPDSSQTVDITVALHATIPPLSLAIDTSPSAEKPERILQLPAAPGSAQLFLSALMSVGLWQAGRSVKHMHLGHLPDWYHTGAVQVGHVTPFDFQSCDLPVCAFDEPAARPVFADRISRERCSQLVSQTFLLIESPRGPPALA